MLFWKISFFQKVTVLENVEKVLYLHVKSNSFENVPLLKRYLFSKSCCCVEVPTSKSSSSVDNFILNNFLHQKSSCSDKVTILKNYLFSWTGCLVEVSLWKSSYHKKNNCRKEATVLENKLLKKSSCSEEIAAPKKWLLCRRSDSEEMWRSSFSKNKAVLKKITTYAIREIVLTFSWNYFHWEVLSPR